MQTAAKKTSVATVWSWLENVPDPEIPVISVVDLGIVRDVVWVDDRLVISVTPTYSGCPATAVISLEIENELRRHDVEKVEIKTILSPAWTTDWITEAGRQKLKDYGIAPPVNGAASCAGALMRPAFSAVECPHCGSSETKCVSQFGSTPCKASYRCEECLEPFDYFKSF
ncbi:MAG: phenylacetate-CoA oxygenase subunit PaaJ [Marinicaulis sp.]|nr:phenylacetate-CoA oxygenase subunit PaaJ [Marinicaulis sp.]NNL88088.1 phenylacetate-CoA oxygenase subunit PaaJ [Marinicaulis sp.]